MYKHFPSLKSLDGYRKGAPMDLNMKQAEPAQEDEAWDYDTNGEQWFDELAFVDGPKKD